jgi:hypothetical protein
MINKARRDLLKFSLVLGGAAALGASAWELASLLPKPESSGTQPTTGTVTQTAAGSMVEKGTSSTTSRNIPLAVKDLQQEITPLFNDLQAFGDGLTDPYSLKAGSDVYTRLVSNGENLREALANYEPENSETIGQVRRLDQIALGTLHLYSWTSRMLEDDMGAPLRSSIGQNLRVVRYPLSELRNILDAEVNPDQTYVQNSGKFSTDITTEYLIAPRFRPGFKALYDPLEPTAKSRLKQLLENQENPTTEAIADYRQVTEEQLAIAYLNNDLLWMDQDNQKHIQTVIENGTARNSSLGEITSRARTFIGERNAALQAGYSQYLDSAYVELPENHRELSDYDFALTLMKTPTFLSERKVGYPENAWDTEFRLERIFYGTASLAERAVYTVSVHPWGSDQNFVDHRAAIKQDSKYYVTAVHGGKYAPTADQLGPPLLYEISDRNWGYTGYREYTFIIVAKSSFGTINVIPMFVYNPQKGIIDLS